VVDQPKFQFKEILENMRKELERKTFLDFIKTVIARQETESKRPGWTIWALFAAGAALISYLLSALEPSSPNWNNVGVIFILISVAIVCLQLIVKCIHHEREVNDKKRRFELTNVSTTDSRLFAVVHCIRMIILFVIYINVQNNLSQLFRKSLVVFLSLNIIASLSQLLFSFLRLPVLKSTNINQRRGLAIVNLLWLGSGLIALIGILNILRNSAISIQDWRVAITLVAISQILVIISQIRHSSALIQDLKGIEQRVALGKLSLPDAQEKADRILYGLTLGDLIRPYVQDALIAIDRLETEHQNLVSQLKVLQTHVSNLSEHHTGKEKTTVYTLLRGVNAQADDVLNASRNAQTTLNKLSKRETLLRKIAPHLANDTASFTKEVQSAKSRVDESLDRTKNIINEIKEEVKQNYLK